MACHTAQSITSNTYNRALIKVKYKETARGGLAVNVIEC